MDRANSNNEALRKFLATLGILATLTAMAGCASLPHHSTAFATPAATGPQGPGSVASASATAGQKGTHSVATAATASAAVPADVAAAATPAPPPKPSPQSYSNLWQRVRAGFALPPLQGPRVTRQEQWFADNPVYMQNMLKRARLYLYYIVQEVQKRGMPTEIALLPAIESAYQPHAYSRARAVGLWQFMASTGRRYGLKTDWWYDGRSDVVASTDAALDYLEKLKNDFNGNWQLALAAYNCGEGEVQYAIDYNRRHGLPTDYSDLRLPIETENYVPKLMAMAYIVADPAKFGLTFPPIPNRPYFARIKTHTQVDLSVVAKLTDIPVQKLYRINPAYVHWVTGPHGAKDLLVPAAKKEAVLRGLRKLPPSERMRWWHHVVHPGDTLFAIAHRYRISISAIMASNDLRSSFLRVGQSLLIPVPMDRLARNESWRQPRVYRAVYRRYRPVHPYHPLWRGRVVRVVHRVRAGETLWSIARRYNVYVRQLRRWNLMDASDVLHLGQRLRIWVRSAPAAALAHVTPSGRG
ncbi:MAG: LysM peptidoglycan-binding domain-containing protein [Gammaproteobacteria bacterium]|nr:LysM peptidoglycan-binding domain-containing protein [Gammaproteobacteria bacterium]